LREQATITIHATLDGDGQAELTAAELACRVALRQQFQNLILFQDSGQQSGTRLINNQSLSGVQIIDGPHFNEVTNGEYVNSRTVDFTAQCEVVLPGAANAIVSWEESVSISGDGSPQYVWRWPVNAEGFPQMTSPHSLITTTQSGRAIGHTDYPSNPEPMFGRNPRGGIYRGDKSSLRPSSPEAMGKGWVNFPIEWAYVYESTRLLGGQIPKPTRPPLA